MKTLITISSKPARVVDIAIQSMLILAGAMGMFGSLHLLLIAQFFLGIWQMLGSIFSMILRRGHYTIKRWLFFIAIVYLVVLASANTTTLWLWIVPAWLLALAYYALTWMNMFPPRKRSSFLPNLSF